MFKSGLTKASTPIITPLTALLLIIAITTGLTVAVHGQGPPAMPHQFYGTVTLNGSSAPAGTTISVYVSGAQAVSTTVDAQGKYGYVATLSVSGANGASVEFYVGGVKASQAASISSGAITRLNLTATGSPSPLPIPPVTSCGITTSSLPAGTVGTAYSATMAASGGTTPYTWSVASGLPAGLTINSATGVISGTPTTAQTYNFTVQANDSASHTCTKALSIQVTTTTTTVSVQSSILGASETFSLSNGVLATAKTLASSDGRVKLGLAANTVINMQGLTQLGAATESNPPAASDNSTMVRSYSFIPSGATFSPAATMTLKYETASLPAGAAESNLYIAWWTGSAWERLSSTVNSTLKEVSAPVAHFTVFSLRHLPATIPAPTTPTTPATPTTPTTPTTPAATAVISASVLNTNSSFSTSGGIVSSATSLGSANGKMSISLAANTAVSLPSGSQQVTVVQLATPPAAPPDAKIIEAYAFGPDNTTFAPAVTVTVKYDPAGLPSDVPETNLYLALLENSNWTTLATSTVDTRARTVSAQISHFSTYALLGRAGAAPAVPATPAAPSAFSTSDLTVSPESANPGEQVTVSVRVVNGGTGEASKTVILKINGEPQEQKEVKLAAGKSQVLSFNVSKPDPGTYTVSVDGQSASFTVKQSSGAPEGMPLMVLAIIIAGGVLIIVLVIVLVMRQRSGGY